MFSGDMRPLTLLTESGLLDQGDPGLRCWHVDCYLSWHLCSRITTHHRRPLARSIVVSALTSFCCAYDGRSLTTAHIRWMTQRIGGYNYHVPVSSTCC